VHTREKRLVGIIALGDIAQAKGGKSAGVALSEISRPSAQHAQM
jgi:hypothetical protein